MLFVSFVVHFVFQDFKSTIFILFSECFSFSISISLLFFNCFLTTASYFGQRLFLRSIRVNTTYTLESEQQAWKSSRQLRKSTLMIKSEEIPNISFKGISENRQCLLRRKTFFFFGSGLTVDLIQGRAGLTGKTSATLGNHEFSRKHCNVRCDSLSSVVIS